jgi:hypothetical protein
MTAFAFKRGTPFWDRLASTEPGECWPWVGAQNGSGYGELRIDGKKIYAHRLAWELANDQPVPEGLFVCHFCDNPPCSNPEHLGAGTHGDNAIEMATRGRASRQRGERHGMCKFTDLVVAEARRLRDSGLTCIEVADATGISPSYVSRLTRGARR